MYLSLKLHKCHISAQNAQQEMNIRHRVKTARGETFQRQTVNSISNVFISTLNNSLFFKNVSTKKRNPFDLFIIQLHFYRVVVLYIYRPPKTLTIGVFPSFCLECGNRTISKIIPYLKTALIFFYFSFGPTKKGPLCHQVKR